MAALVTDAMMTLVWPSVTDPPMAGPGILGTLGTIIRPDGSAHATYDRHPLRTYLGHTAPGQANGNSLNPMAALA